MATKKTTIKAEYEKDTAKGKRRYRVEGDKVAGTLYLEKGSPYFEEETLNVTLVGADD